MATEIPIPKLGQSEETVTIESWRVKEGDNISKGDVLFEVETDKAVLEVESQFEGTLLKIIIPAGIEVPVMSTAAFVGEPGEKIPDIKAPEQAKPKSKPEAAKPEPKTEAKAQAPEKDPKAMQQAVLSPNTTAVDFPAPAAASEKPKPSPRARAFAADYLIDLDKVNGTGGEVGRVTEADVKRYLDESGYFERKITPAAFNLAKIEELALPDIEGSGDQGRVTLADVRAAAAEKPRELSAMRKIIAQRLTRSKQDIPHFYVTTSVDMTELMAKREELKKQGIKLSVNVFIVKAVALSLRAFPMLNARMEGERISYRSKVNVGVAVSLDSGLVVPVVRNADRMALDEIQADVAEMAEKARSGKLTPDAMQGGTFTISNMGMLGVENFAAIINPGETGILAVSATIPTPVAVDGEIVVRPIMKVTLSADHRAVDGADGARFLQVFKARLEDPRSWDRMV